jgi:hypothetical protein
MPKYQFRTILVLVILGFLIFAGAGRAKADAAPPAQAPGGVIGQQGQTKVQMMSERVEFDTYSLDSTEDASDYPYVAVTAYFVMRNQGQAIEQLATRFPMNSWLDKAQGLPI